MEIVAKTKSTVIVNIELKPDEAHILKKLLLRLNGMDQPISRSEISLAEKDLAYELGTTLKSILI